MKYLQQEIQNVLDEACLHVDVQDKPGLNRFIEVYPGLSRFIQVHLLAVRIQMEIWSFIY